MRSGLVRYGLCLGLITNMTQAEMLAEIAKAMTRVPAKDGPVGVTTREMAERWGITVQNAWRRMELMLAEGKIRYVGKAPRPSRVEGEWRKIPVYAPTKK